MSDLNNMNPTPPKEVREKLAKQDQETKNHLPAERTNDSEVDPKMPKKDILRGFHGG